MFRDSYVLCIYVMNILCTFHISVSWIWYRCTAYTLTKRMERKLEGNSTRMLRAILNKSWRQHPTKKQLYGHLPPISKTIHIRRARNAVHCIFICILAFMLNFKIYFGHKYKTTNKTKEKKRLILIEKFIYSLRNIKAVKTVILTILKT